MGDAPTLFCTLYGRETNIINITYNSQFTIHNSDIAYVIYMYIV